MRQDIQDLIDVLNANPQGCNQFGCKAGAGTGRSVRSIVEGITGATRAGPIAGKGSAGLYKRGSKMRKKQAQQLREQRSTPEGRAALKKKAAALVKMREFYRRGQK